MRGNAYLSRPVGSNEPPRFHRRNRQFAVKEVSIGNMPATTKLHHAVAVDRFIPVEDLYDNRRRR